jgi:hypothetical protein
MMERFGYIGGGSNTMDARIFVDETGKPRQVLLDFEEYQELLERAEDSEALAFLRKFKSEPHKYVGLEEALAGLGPDV